MVSNLYATLSKSVLILRSCSLTKLQFSGLNSADLFTVGRDSFFSYFSSKFSLYLKYWNRLMFQFLFMALKYTCIDIFQGGATQTQEEESQNVLGKKVQIIIIFI